MASRTKLPRAVTTVNTDGQKRVKPSEVLRPAAHATSSRPAIKRRTQDMRRTPNRIGAVPVDSGCSKVVLASIDYIKMDRNSPRRYTVFDIRRRYVAAG